MSASGAGRIRAAVSGRIQPGPRRATRLELFLDLVFVYAFFNVTALMSANFHPVGLFEGFLVVALLWRCWASYAWFGNTVRFDRGSCRWSSSGRRPASSWSLSPCRWRTRTGRVAGGGPSSSPSRSSWCASCRWRHHPRRAQRRRPAPVRPTAWLPLCVTSPLLLAAASLPALLPDRPPVRLGLAQVVLFTVATAVDYAGLAGLGSGDWRLGSVGIGRNGTA